MDFELSPTAKDLQARLLAFMDDHVYPAEAVYREQMEAAGDPNHHPQIVEDLKAEARSQGLWNLFLPHKTEWTDGLSNTDYAPLAEITGRSSLAPEALNCAAPDTGNMEILTQFGTPEQQEQWLQPLLEGEIRSCFAMTEPEVASSDATNIRCEIKRDGADYVINGRKWWTSGAASHRCKVAIVMGKTDPDAPVHLQQSMVLVPLDTPGVTIVRNLPVFGYYDREGHSEVLFEDVRVPVSNVLGEEGGGFAIAQARLGPGRIHHCMRCIGAAERALELMCRRVRTRTAFGKTLSDQGVIREWIAESRIELDQARLLTMYAAWLMDTVGNKAARTEISAIKVVAPNVALNVIDRAIQAHGGAGVSDDFPLAAMYAGIRTLRLADGPDEVHKVVIARRELRKYEESTPPVASPVSSGDLGVAR
jgi:acyl-CoA dehydrogenase